MNTMLQNNENHVKNPQQKVCLFVNKIKWQSHHSKIHAK